MTAPQVKMSNYEDIPDKVGLKDGGHTILRCSACDKPIADIWVVKPNAINPHTRKPFEWKCVATCCYCGDKSYPVTVKGRIAHGGYGENKADPEGGMDDANVFTVVYRVEPKGDTIIFHTKRGNAK